MPRQKSTHIDDPAAVGARLRVARERAGLSQRQLAFSGCTPAYISRIEAGQRIPSLQLLRSLGERLGVTADYLATGADEPAATPTASALVDGSLALRLDELDRAEAAFALVLGSAPSARERAAALTGLGHVAQRRGAVSEAVSLFEDAIAACAGDDPEPELAEGLGRAYASLGELASAIAVLRAALRRAREQGDTTLEIRFACLLGYALTDNGDFAEAERVIGEALETGRHLSDPYTRARLLWSRSRLLGEQGRGDLAARHALEALSILKLTEDAYAIGRAHQLLAGIYVSTERIDEAAELLREARPLIEANATPVEVAHFEIDEARVLARLGERERAASLAMSATGKLRGAMPMVAGDAYLLLGEIYEELGDVERAREVYELAVELLAEQPPSRYLVEANTRLATLLERLERPDLALEALKRALGVQSRVGRPLS